jgi:hypothetical protein
MTAARVDRPRCQRVEQPDGSEVDPVIIGLVRHVDAGWQRVERRRR